MEINGHCKTNLDDYDASKVRLFTRTPNIGERVACLYKGKETTLKIVQITHDYKNGAPYLIIELHH